MCKIYLARIHNRFIARNDYDEDQITWLKKEVGEPLEVMEYEEAIQRVQSGDIYRQYGFGAQQAVFAQIADAMQEWIDVKCPDSIELAMMIALNAIERLEDGCTATKPTFSELMARSGYACPHPDGWDAFLNVVNMNFWTASAGDWSRVVNAVMSNPSGRNIKEAIKLAYAGHSFNNTEIEFRGAHLYRVDHQVVGIKGGIRKSGIPVEQLPQFLEQSEIETILNGGSGEYSAASFDVFIIKAVCSAIRRYREQQELAKAD
jgi:hypothetical protein